MFLQRSMMKRFTYFVSSDSLQAFSFPYVAKLFFSSSFSNKDCESFIKPPPPPPFPQVGLFNLAKRIAGHTRVPVPDGFLPGQ